MNKKGFTLVELLIVIVILGIIAMIALPNIFEMINESKINGYKKYEKTLIDNIEMYNIDLQEDIWFENETSFDLTLSQLKERNQDLEENKDCLIENLNIIKEDNRYKYNVCIKCNQKEDGTYLYQSNYCK